ncbi:MAG: peptide-methionine (S)-S-oxide reductase MsrA [Reyranellaceae bacterium]
MTLHPRRRAALLGALSLLAVGLQMPRARAEGVRLVPPPTVDQATPTGERATAVLAGGCFWGVQGVFQHVDGVLSAVSGYAGGAKETARYQQVGSGRTGHAESVRVIYDPRRISYGQLLRIYFSVAHDPTELDRQGPDEGPQYRSTIFPADDEQERIARAYIEQLNRAGTFGKSKVVTTVELGRAFYPAEAYHQDYLTLHPRQPYIVMFDLPKLEALRKLFPASYRAEPVLVASTGI